MQYSENMMIAKETKSVVVDNGLGDLRGGHERRHVVRPETRWQPHSAPASPVVTRPVGRAANYRAGEPRVSNSSGVTMIARTNISLKSSM